METKKIAVGSLNPVKINAALAGFKAMFRGESFDATGFDVPSGVNEQPMSRDETLAGATNRANEVFKAQKDFDFYVGIEGGIEWIHNSMFASAWIVIIDREGTVARGRSGSFALPPKARDLVESGVELGLANDQIFDEQNSKQAGGAVGSLTGGVITRQCLYEHAMALTLIGVKNAELYFEEDGLG
ncbi:MAG: inosine/xanthosine triphosphatase [Planctomycetota bacterium]